MESKKQNKYTFFILEDFCLNFQTQFGAARSLTSLNSGSDADLAALQRIYK